jgi:hypothetical protein
MDLPKDIATRFAARLKRARVPAKRVEDAIARARPTIIIEAGGTGRSRVGGEPELPKGTPWPDYEGAPLCFVAQIDCAEAARVDPRGELPHDGTLSFFMLPGIVTPNRRKKRYGSFLPSRVLWFPEKTALAVRRTPAKGLPSNPVYPATAIGLRGAWTLPNDTELLDISGYGKTAWELEGGLPTDRLLGWGYGTYDGPRMPPEGATLLLALELGWKGYMDWEDFGVAFFCIPDEALRARRFEEVIAYPSNE